MAIELGTNKLKDEHISPEGVEEKVLTRLEYMITNTMGGKFRVYGPSDSGEAISVSVHNTMDEAKLAQAQQMLLFSALIVDPEGTKKHFMSVIASLKK